MKYIIIFLLILLSVSVIAQESLQGEPLKEQDKLLVQTKTLMLSATSTIDTSKKFSLKEDVAGK